MSSPEINKSRRKVIRIALLVVGGYFLLAWVINRANNAIFSVHSEKIWVHRVNSIEKLEEVQPKFQGVELDVVFEGEGNFDVNHPPAESINLSLREYFAAANFSNGYGIWLDVKNLDLQNAEQALLTLTQLCSDFSISPDQIIVESTDASVLPPFSESGFRTSFYLPQHLSDESSESQENVLNELNPLMALYPTDYLSTNRSDYSFVRSKFPESKILTWSFDYDTGLSLNPITLYRESVDLFSKIEVLSDDKVKVVLFGYKAEEGNR